MRSGGPVGSPAPAGATAIPRSTGSFISQLRELEQIREMVTSSTISTIVDLPFFFLFIVVLVGLLLNVAIRSTREDSREDLPEAEDRETP